MKKSDRMNPRGVSLSGLAGSGKDALADVLVNERGYRKGHFAYDLKRVAFEYFGWNGTLDATGCWQGGKDAKGRVMLQHVGTEVGRAYLDQLWIIKFARRHGLFVPGNPSLPGDAISTEEKIRILAEIKKSDEANEPEGAAKIVALLEFGWDGRSDAAGERLIAEMVRVSREYNDHRGLVIFMDGGFDYAEDKIRNPLSSGEKTTAPLVVPDCRFPNEIDLLKANSFATVTIERPGLTRMNHASETSLVGATFDYLVNNDGTLEDYNAKVRSLVDLIADDSDVSEKGRTIQL